MSNVENKLQITNAKVFQQQLGLGSYRTAWTLLQKIRKVMGDCNPAKLSGVISVDRLSTHKKSTTERFEEILYSAVRTDPITYNEIVTHK